MKVERKVLKKTKPGPSGHELRVYYRGWRCFALKDIGYPRTEKTIRYNQSMF